MQIYMNTETQEKLHNRGLWTILFVHLLTLHVLTFELILELLTASLLVDNVPLVHHHHESLVLGLLAIGLTGSALLLLLSLATSKLITTLAASHD